MLHQVFEVLSCGLDTDPQSFLWLVYCFVDDVLFEVSPKAFFLHFTFFCYCCYGNHAAGSKPI